MPVQFHSKLQRKARYVVDVMDFGAVGDGVADDAAAVQAAIDAAEAISPTGTVIAPNLIYKIDTGITILDCNVRFERGASFLVDDSVAVGITIGSSSQSCDNKELTLPNVNRETYDWDSNPTIGSRRGILFAAADACQITVPGITKFSYGLVLEGDGQGVTYNTFFLGAFQSNAINLFIDYINMGWSNQNTFISGRLANVDIGGSPPYAGTRQIVIGSNKTGNPGTPDGNLFLGVSIEGNNDEFKIECWGVGNRWLNCRFEVDGSPAVAWRAYDGTWYSHSNVIDGGWDTDAFVVTADANSRYNSIFSPKRWIWEGSNADAIFALANANNDLNGIKLFKAAGVLSDKNFETEYQVNLAAGQIGLKAEADDYNRIEINTVLGRLYMGTGGSDPTANGFLRYSSGMYEWTVGIRIESGGELRSGSGTPEGAVAAPVSSLFMRTDGGANTTLYVKETGSGDTGWVAK